MIHLIAIALALSAQEPIGQPPPEGAAQVPGQDVLVESTDLMLRKTTPGLQFSWEIPPDVARIPTLLTQMRADAERQLDTAERTFNQARAKTLRGRPEPSDDLLVSGHTYFENWTVEADTPRLLSLLGTVSGYNGQRWRSSKMILWDKAASRRIAFADLFTSWPEAQTSISQLYCAALQRELAHRRTGDTPSSVHCPSLDVMVITFVGRENGIDHIRIQPSSDAIGPIDITLPKDVLALVRPDYRADLGDKP